MILYALAKLAPPLCFGMKPVRPDGPYRSGSVMPGVGKLKYWFMSKPGVAMLVILGTCGKNGLDKVSRLWLVFVMGGRGIFSGPSLLNAWTVLTTS